MTKLNINERLMQFQFYYMAICKVENFNQF